jgi:hypothetical protein
MSLTLLTLLLGSDLLLLLHAHVLTLAATWTLGVVALLVLGAPLARCTL